MHGSWVATKIWICNYINWLNKTVNNNRKQSKRRARKLKIPYKLIFPINPFSNL